MISHKDNTHNRKLRELLDKNKHSENPDMDDFEKEAMEGFAMLQDEEEILDLKATLDKKIYPEVFEEKKSNRKYWYAAAGLFLVIGFTIYFVRNNPVAKNSDLAIRSEQHTPANAIQKKLEDETNKKTELRKAEDLKQAPQSPEIEKRPEKKNGKFKGKQEEPLLEKKADDNTSLGAVSEDQPKTENVPMLADREEKGLTKESDLNAAPVVIAQSQSAYSQKVDVATINYENHKNKLSKPVTVETRKKSADSYNSEGTGASPSSPAAGAAAPGVITVTFSCYYTGGEEALNKDLKNILSAKNPLQKFDATLYINKKGGVQKVIFTNVFNLNKEQQKQVKETLQSLTKFNVTNDLSQKKLVEYKVVFRP